MIQKSKRGTVCAGSCFFTQPPNELFFKIPLCIIQMSWSGSIYGALNMTEHQNEVQVSRNSGTLVFCLFPFSSDPREAEMQREESKMGQPCPSCPLARQGGQSHILPGRSSRTCTEARHWLFPLFRLSEEKESCSAVTSVQFEPSMRGPSFADPVCLSLFGLKTVFSGT